MAKSKFIDVVKIGRFFGEIISGGTILGGIAVVDWLMQLGFNFLHGVGFDGFSFEAVTLALHAILVIDLVWLVVYIGIIGKKLLMKNLEEDEDA